MAQRFIALTEADYALFMRMLDWWKKQTGSNLPTEPPKPSQAPETYIAKTPAGGIPARSGVTPGTADCTIYKVNSSEELEEVTNFSKTVLNLSLAAVSGDLYVNIVRDKYGRWIVAPTDAAAGTGTGTECASSLGGLNIADLPTINSSEVTYVITTNGRCIGKTPKSTC